MDEEIQQKQDSSPRLKLGGRFEGCREANRQRWPSAGELATVRRFSVGVLRPTSNVSDSSQCLKTQKSDLYWINTSITYSVIGDQNFNFVDQP